MSEITITFFDNNAKLIDAVYLEIKRLHPTYFDMPEEQRRIHFKHKDLYDIKTPIDALVSPANSYGMMTGGIDRAINNWIKPDRGLFPFITDLPMTIEEIVQKKIKEDFDGNLRVGQATIVNTLDSQCKYLIVAPTMHLPMDVSHTYHAYQALFATYLEILKHNSTKEDKIQNVYCPGLGTLTGRISAKEFARQIYNCITDLEFLVNLD